VAARILLDFDADSEKIRNEVIRMLSGPGGRRQGQSGGSGGSGSSGSPGEGKKSSKLLDQFGRNLTKLAAEGSSIRSSAARRRSSGSCRSSRGARRTTRS